MWNRLFYVFHSKPIQYFYGCRSVSTSLANGSTSKSQYDVAVIGGGIVGTSVARKLKLDRANLNVCLIEKECAVGKHQSSHNSGVMHCGVYYTPGSLKAKFCVEGIELLQRFCDDKKINYKKRGKLIVATNCSELSVLNELLERGRKNKVKDMKLVDSRCEIQQMASGCRGIKALWCPQTANVNFKEVTQQFSKDFEDAGGRIILNTRISDIKLSSDCDYPLDIIPEEGAPMRSKFAITCGGLQSDSLTKLLTRDDPSANQHFISLKVDYQKINSQYCDNLDTNLYPVPDLEVPFLGAHFSPQLDGSVLLGPYAMPALKVEGYCNDEVNLAYLSKMVTSCGFRNMVIRNFSKCVGQASKAVCSEVQIKDLQQLLPSFSYQFVEKGPTAVQCQLLNRDGTFVDDFVFDIFASKGVGQRVINVKFTPSPAATSSLAIANYVVEEFTNKTKECS